VRVPTYSLTDLAKIADVTPRTIRYYIQQGLLPSPDLQGPSTRYSDEHLERLLLIKRLQSAHLPLAEIRAQLDSVPKEQLSAIVDAVAQPPSNSAVDYIRDLLEPPTTYARSMPSMPAPAALRSAAGMPAMRDPTEVPPQMLRRSMEEPEPVSEPKLEARSTAPDRSQWERVSLDPDVEIHIRRPMTRHNNKRVERLIRIARELFEED